MNRCGSTCLLTVTLVAINLFLGPAELATAQNGNYPSPNCPDDVASLGGIQDGSRPTMLSVNPVIEVEFLLDFGCHESNLPTRIDEGVRLEFSLQSADSSTNTGWLPIRYYAPSLDMPNDNTSLVELDSSNVSVTVQASMCSFTFPLILIEPARSLALIREYICIPHVQNFTVNLQLQLRWMQKFERPSSFNTAPWILDDINIRIWNGTCFLEVLSEDFIDNFNFDSYELSLGFKQRQHCELSNAIDSLLFEYGSTSPTMRFLTVNVTNIPVSFEDRVPFNPVRVYDSCPTKEDNEKFLEDALQWLASEFGVVPLGLAKSFAAKSCQEVADKSSLSKSGLYWITNGTNTEQEYCQF